MLVQDEAEVRVERCFDERNIVWAGEVGQRNGEGLWSTFSNGEQSVPLGRSGLTFCTS